MAKKKSKPTAKALSEGDGPDFETSMADVERIVADLESGELGLSESLEQYETGIKRLKRCHSLLAAAEQKVSLLSGFDADGNPITTAMDETTVRTGTGRTTQPAASRAKRTSGSSSGEDPAGNGPHSESNMDEGEELF